MIAAALAELAVEPVELGEPIFALSAWWQEPVLIDAADESDFPELLLPG